MYTAMIETAEVVARALRRSAASRRTDTRCRVSSAWRRRTPPGRFEAEIVPLAARKLVTDKASGATTPRRSLLKQDEGSAPTRHSRHWPSSSRSGPAASSSRRVRIITAGNASQLSDGAAAWWSWTRAGLARDLEPLGRYRGMAVAGCAPEEMGIGPVFAVPKLLRGTGLRVADIGLWELNEAFAVQALYCRDRLGIDNEQA